MVYKLIRDITICLCVAIVCAFLMFIWAVMNGGLNVWMLIIFGLGVSTIHIFTRQTPLQFLKFFKLFTPLLAVFILSYMVYVEFNYPKTEDLLELSASERGFKILSEFTKLSIANFLPRFISVLSLKLLVACIAGFALGTFGIKSIKYKDFIKNTFHQEPLDDGNLVKKHTKRKSKKFGRRF